MHTDAWVQRFSLPCILLLISLNSLVFLHMDLVYHTCIFLYHNNYYNLHDRFYHFIKNLDPVVIPKVLKLIFLGEKHV